MEKQEQSQMTAESAMQVEKEPTPVSTLNPAAKAFQPGKAAGVLHLAVREHSAGCTA